MSTTVDFIYDFASPNAYLCHKMLGGIEERTGATFRYVPCLLGGIFKSTGNQAPFVAFSGVKGKMDYERLELMRFVKRNGLSKFTMNPNFPMNTVMLMRGAIAAEQAGVQAAYIEAGMKAMWEDGQNMSDPEVFAQVFTEAGLDGAELLTQTQAPEIKQALVDNTAAAVERGVFGIPTFFVGDEMFFGKERLGQIEEEISSQKT